MLVRRWLAIIAGQLRSRRLMNFIWNVVHFSAGGPSYVSTVIYYVDCDLCDRRAAFLGLPTRRTWFESRLEQLWPSVEGSGPFYRWPRLKEPIFIWKYVFHMGATPAPRHHPSESNLKVPDFFKRLREVIQWQVHWRASRLKNSSERVLMWLSHAVSNLNSWVETPVKRYRPCWSWFLDWHQLVLQLIYSDCGLRCFRYQLKIAYSPFLYSWELAPMNLCSRPKHPRRSKDLGLSDTGRSTKEHG